MNVDGVLTDGSVYISQNGEEVLRFSRYDLYGLQLLKQTEIIPIILSYYKSKAAQKFLEKFKIAELHFGITNKLRMLEQIAAKYDCPLVDIAFIGNEVNDLEVFSHVSLPIAVKDAQKDVLQMAHYITAALGGNGAVREVCNMIIEAKLAHGISEIT